jgi:hypothetical protein
MKILICTKFCGESPHDLIPGEQYYVKYNNDTKLHVVYKDNQLVGYFNDETLNNFFQPIDVWRDNNIDKILQ